MSPSRDGPSKGEDRLRDLWRRRPTLSEQEWGELYAIVLQVLRGRCTGLVARLPGSREELIQDFFEDKVLSLGQYPGEIYHASVLVEFYRRYLISRSRDPYHQRVIKEHAGASEDETAPTQLDQALSQQSVEAEIPDDAEDARALTDWIADELDDLLADASSRTAPGETRGLLEQYLGIELERVVHAAGAFLDGRDQWSDLVDDAWWIRLYLRCHFCAAHPGAMALSTLARRHQVPSYHYKAVALGTTVPKRREAALESFRSSHRGRWLASLGIPVDLDHLVEISLALKVLCLVALKSQEPC